MQFHKLIYIVHKINSSTWDEGQDQQKHQLKLQN